MGRQGDRNLEVQRELRRRRTHECCRNYGPARAGPVGRARSVRVLHCRERIAHESWDASQPLRSASLAKVSADTGTHSDRCPQR
jgi:hypothetical protein